MNKKYKISEFAKVFCLFFVLLLAGFSIAQNMKLVWADEFDNSIDFSLWDYGIGPSNDNIHYYTNRNENIQIVDNVLNIIALEESYMGFNYTSGLLKTKIHWQYGRIEARIKLPKTKGFVPAFWMLPADNVYGWWPNSGEIDIMEHPTNQITTIYGTIHSETYNSFTGIGPEGSNINIPDAETEFHIYAIEWNKDQIDFYVDEQMYFSHKNDQSGSAKWPFDNPFFIILNLAVGGGWVGNPDETTLFPAIMEVDYVRVYQDLKDISIYGEDFVSYNNTDIAYSVPNIVGADYSWEVPGNAQVVAGQNTNQIFVDWNYFGGDIIGQVITEQVNQIIEYPVKVSSNLFKNSGFEVGVKYWNQGVGYPAEAYFSLNNENAFTGNSALRIDVKKLSAYPWDVQLSQKEKSLDSGQNYELGFWARSDNTEGELYLAIINSDFYVYHGEKFKLTNDWEYYETEYTATKTDIVNINVDLGYQTGVYYLDNFQFTTPELSNANQIENAGFFEGDSYWDFITLSSAQAKDTVINGELMVSITDGGIEVWDIHLGQSGLNFEKGKEYTVSFDAYAETPRTISVIVGMSESPWTVYSGIKIYPLLAEKQTFSFSFIMNDATDDKGRFGFDIGGSNVDVFFDNVRVSSGTIPASISKTQISPESIRLYQNYPNPFNPKTTINYEVRIKSNITLTLFDISGRKVKTLVNEWQAAGEHSISLDATDLPSGIYIYKLKAGSHEQSRKMLVIR